MTTVASAGVLAPRLTRELGRLLLWVRPDGWQSRARRNAWAAMVADRQARQSRPERTDPEAAALAAQVH